jgi:hypothetical protein
MTAGGRRQSYDITGPVLYTIDMLISTLKGIGISTTKTISKNTMK